MRGDREDVADQGLARATDVDRAQSWFAAATDRAMLGRSVVTCLVVGALLTAINHGDRLLRGEFGSIMAWQVGLTFLVPFLVATTSGAAAMRSRAGHRRDHPDAGPAGHDSALDLEGTPAPPEGSRPPREDDARRRR